MNTKNFGRGFTLIEMLVVIAIIGILAGLGPAALGPAKTRAQKRVTQVEEHGLVTAISQYTSEYDIPPASTNAVAAAAAPNSKINNDFTFGSVVNVPNYPVANLLPNLHQQVTTPGSAYQNANSEVISILRDDNNYPEANTNANVYHLYNSRKTHYFDPPKISSGAGSPGIDANSIFRDLWGNPYFVTLDMNGDGRCYDKSWMGPLTGNNNFSVAGEAIVWSLGPTGNFDPTQPLSAPINKDLVYSWK